jgi:hypothetical protein
LAHGAAIISLEGWWIVLVVIDVGKSVVRVVDLTIKYLSK